MYVLYYINNKLYLINNNYKYYILIFTIIKIFRSDKYLPLSAENMAISARVTFEPIRKVNMDSSSFK